MGSPDRRLPAVADVPVIFLAGQADPGRMAQARDLMLFGYLLTPVDPAELTVAIEAALKRHQAAALHLIYQRAITTSSAGMIVCDARQPDCPIIEVNPRFEQMTGYAAAEIVGRGCRFLQGPASDPAARAALRDGVRHAVEARVTILNYRKDGTTFWNEVTIYPVRDAAGQVTHFVGQQTDVTERVLAEQASRQGHEMLQRANAALIELARSRCFQTGDAAGFYREITEALRSGLTADRTAVWLATPDDRRLVAQDIFDRPPAAAEAGHTRGLELAQEDFPEYFLALQQERFVSAADAPRDPRTERLSGHWEGRTMSAMLSAGVRRGGRHVGTICAALFHRVHRWTREEELFIGGVADLVALFLEGLDRRRVEEELRESQTRLLEAQRIAGIGNWERTLPDQTLRLSEQVYRIFGRDPATFGNTFAAFLDIVHPDDRAAVSAAARHAEATGAYDVEYRVVRPGGEVRSVRAQGEAARGADGRVRRVFGTVQDVTDQRAVLASLRRSEERLAEAQRIAHLGNWEWNIAANTVWRSDEVFRIYERTPAELPPTFEAFLAVVHPDDRELVTSTVRDSVGALQPYSLDYRVFLPSGKVRIIYEHGRVVADAAGRPVRLFGTVQDVTKQRLALAALRDSAERFRATFEQAAVGVAHVSLDGHWLRVNARLCEIVGYRREELTQLTFRDVTHPEDLADNQESVEQLRAGRTRHSTQEKRYLRKDGGVVWINLTVSLVRDRLGQPLYYIAVVEDIMRRKLAEAALQEKEAHLRAIIANEPECVQRMDRRGQILEINPAGLAMLEADTLEQLVARDATELVGEKYRDAWREMLAATFRGEPQKLEFEITALRGARRWVELHSAPLREAGEQGEVKSILAVLRDSTQRRQAEIAFETLLRSTAAAVGVDFFPTLVKELGALLVVRHVYVAEIVPEEPHRARTLAFCRGGELAENFEYELARSPCHDAMQSGTLSIREKVRTLYPDCHASRVLGAESFLGIPLYSNRREVIGFFAVLDDRPATFDRLSRSLISVFAVRVEAELQRLHAEEDRRRIETQFFQAQKMEALGTLAGGVAHDFNNILTGILNYAELAKMSAPENTEVVNYIDEVTNAGRRARDLVAQILAFSRSELCAPQPMHLDPVVREALRLLRSTLPANVEIVQRMADDAPVVLADPSQMHQVVMNLCVNASQAIRDRTGRIEVGLAAFKADRKFVHQHPGFPPGVALKLTVSDTGPGMDQRTLNRIFEPFFTTKAPGEGTGLGLPVVHGIVKNHRGVIEVFSQPGEGVTVQVYLPAYDSANDRESGDPWNGDPSPAPAGRQERILLVDDEVGVADSTRLMLENLGYRVTMHCDSEQAYDVFAQAPDQYDLVLTDYLMPRMNGVVLAEKILALRSEMPILMTSGFVSNWSPEKLREHGIRDLVPKPTSVVDLAWIISRTLQKAATE
ncbi:MAG: PAS domain S-box protein [Opitutae bacterium]|nr:PAS domain S-box protein [Opitutae bacterium]